MKKTKKNVIGALACLAISMGTVFSLSSFSSYEQSVGTNITALDTDTDTDNSLFEEEHTSTVQCTDTRWTTTKYYDRRGELLGVTMWSAAAGTTVTYSGSYYSYTVEKGGVEAHTATMTECYNWGWGCHKITAAEACE